MAGIASPAHGQQPDAFGHGRGHHVEDAAGRVHRGQTEGVGNGVPYGPFRLIGKEGIPSAEEVAGIEVTQNQVGVRNRGLIAAPAVTGRTGFGPGAPGPDVQRSSVVHPRNASAARAQCVEIDHRHGDLPSPFVVFPRDLGIACFDHRDIGARSAHVESDEIGGADQAAVGDGPADSSCRPGEYGLHGLPRCHVQWRYPSIGRHCEYVAREAQAGRLLLHAFEIPGVDRTHIGVYG